jgi:ATP-dependent DNA ligase
MHQPLGPASHVRDNGRESLPEMKSGRWGAGLTLAKMTECRWVTPTLVAQFEFVEWTGDNHLRHSRFIALRDDKMPMAVQRE